MFGDVFYFLLSMSIVAGITGCIVLLIRRIKKIPRRVVMWLWIIPLIRMCIPFGISGKYSLMTLLSKYATKTVVEQDGLRRVGDYIGNGSNIGGNRGLDFEYSFMNYVSAVDSYDPMVYKVNVLEDVFNVASVIWIMVVVDLCLTFLFIYRITLSELSNAVHIKDNLFISDKIYSPAVYGIVRPRIIIPKSYEDKNLEYVLMHENAHIKRGDNFWRVVAFFVTSIHWFNPLSWIFLKCFLEDLELSCDEKVLAKCRDEQKKEYALSLVECVERRSVFASAFGGAGIRMRIENVISYKKMSIVSLSCFIILVVAIMYMLLTNAA